MPELLLDKLQEYRSKTYRTSNASRLRDLEDAVRFVYQRGFVFFWPIKNTELPSLWTAAAGDRPVPNNHDDPGHITWRWKDEMLGKRRWYYGRILRQRNTIISLETTPYFYALSPNYGDYENDYLDQYDLGNLTYEAKQLYETLLQEGPLDTITLRRKAHLTASSNTSRFNRALNILQSEFKILPIGVSEAGAWRYSFVYEIVPRYYPEMEKQAREISEGKAREKLVELYLRSVGAVEVRKITSLFKWKSPETLRAVKSLISNNIITDQVNIPNTKGTSVALQTLL